MRAIFIKCLVIFVLISVSDGAIVKKFKRRVSGGNHGGNRIHQKRNETARGLFLRDPNGHEIFLGGLFSLSKVLNFFPVGGERECRPAGHHAARAGICLNAYDCRQRDGQASGDCAHGLGVCCVFEVSCGGVVQNNLTYFMSPGFPQLWSGDQDCSITVDKTHAGIMQLRIDFDHFTIGQPNRATGECDEDAMVLRGGETNFTICGQNHGQHIYYTLSTKTEAREADDLPGTATTSLTMRMRGADMPRLWLLRLAQMPLAHAAPHECLQYHTADNGTIKSFNYATNGRHLASQDYKICIRRNIKHCSVRYAPCDSRAFRIGPAGGVPNVIDPADLLGPGSAGGPGTGFYGPDGSFIPGVTSDQTSTEPVAVDQDPMDTVLDEMMPADETMTQEDEIEGSGDDPQSEDTIEQPGMMSRIWSYITSWMWGQSSGRSLRWSPYAQHYSDDDQYRYFGYGNFGVGLTGHGRQRCQDRITIPCENEYFVSSQYYGIGVCDPHHCGNTFCPGQNPAQCHIETSITPFAVSVHFGPPTAKRSPEENIGMCLKYSQQPCDSES